MEYCHTMHASSAMSHPQHAPASALLQAWRGATPHHDQPACKRAKVSAPTNVPHPARCTNSNSTRQISLYSMHHSKSNSSNVHKRLSSRLHSNHSCLSQVSIAHRAAQRCASILQQRLHHMPQTYRQQHAQAQRVLPGNPHMHKTPLMKLTAETGLKQKLLAWPVNKLARLPKTWRRGLGEYCTTWQFLSRLSLASAGSCCVVCCLLTCMLPLQRCAGFHCTKV